jgi:biotin transport system substrate-specific component
MDYAQSYSRTLVGRAGVRVDVLWTVAAAGLIAVCAQVAIPLPFTPVPVTGQTFAVVLSGAALGAVRGGAGALLYVLAGVAGAPVYADADHGLSVVTGATGGYLLAFPLAAALVGLLAERRWDRTFSSALGALLTGNVVVYAVGLPWLALSLHTNLDRTLAYGLYPFIVGDLLKVYLAATLLPAAWRLIPRR